MFLYDHYTPSVWSWILFLVPTRPKPPKCSPFLVFNYPLYFVFPWLPFLSVNHAVGFRNSAIQSDFSDIGESSSLSFNAMLVYIPFSVPSFLICRKQPTGYRQKVPKDFVYSDTRRIDKRQSLFLGVNRYSFPCIIFFFYISCSVSFYFRQYFILFLFCCLKNV